MAHIQKIKIMASGPITPWQIDRETMEKVTDFILVASKITADGNCSHEIKKQRHYFANVGHLVKAVIFPVLIYGC